MDPILSEITNLNHNLERPGRQSRASRLPSEEAFTIATCGLTTAFIAPSRYPRAVAQRFGHPASAVIRLVRVRIRRLQRSRLLAPSAAQSSALEGVEPRVERDGEPAPLSPGLPEELARGQPR